MYTGPATVWVGYKTDTWHSYASRDTLCICSNQETMIELLQIHAKKSGKKINKQELWNLRNIKQTQGYKGEGEYHSEEINLNSLI